LAENTGGTLNVTVNPLNGFTGNVSFTASGFPSGPSYTFLSNSSTSYTLVVFVPTGTAVGNYPITVTGTSGNLTATTTFTFTVTSTSTTATPTFSPAPGTYTSAQTVTLSDATSGAVIHCTTNGTTPTANSPVCTTLTVSATTNIEAIAVATGSNNSAVATGVYTISAPQPSFTLSAGSKTFTLAPNQGGTDFISVNPVNGFNGNVTFTYSGFPSAVSTAVTPTSSTSGTQLVAFVPTGTAASTSTVTVTGTSGSLTASVTLTFVVSAPTASFNLSMAASSLSLPVNTGGTIGVNVLPLNGFNSNVTFSISGLPANVTYAFSPTSSSTGTTLVLFAQPGTVAGTTSTVTVTGTSGSLTASTTFSLIIPKPAGTFTLTTSTSTLSVFPVLGGSLSVNVVPANGFTGTVTFSVSGVPSGTTATFNPASSTTGSTLTLTPGLFSGNGNYTITVTGTSGSTTATAKFTLSII
jgi:hypothetical protein